MDFKEEDEEEDEDKDKEEDNSKEDNNVNEEEEEEEEEEELFRLMSVWVHITHTLSALSHQNALSSGFKADV